MSVKLTVTKQEELRCCKMAYTREGVVIMDFMDDVLLQVQDIEDMAACIQRLTGGRKCAVLVLTGSRNDITKEAREHELSNYDLSLADGIVVKNLPTRIMTRFYLKFNPPKHPYKIFAKEEEAIIWLMEFVN